MASLQSNPQKGLLLLNLGTPNSTKTSDVRKYLAEFLMDRHVIDIPWAARFALVYGIILPLRPKKSAAAYKQIFTERGSPLLFHLVDLRAKVSQLLQSEFKVEMAMRYGNPNIESALRKFQADGISNIQVMPLYPQYSLAATHSSVSHSQAVAKKLGFKKPLTFLSAFYQESGFINSFAEVSQQAMANFNADYVLFSFHGLPERQIRRVDLTATHCFASENCCDTITLANANCYRAQSFASAHAIAAKLGFSKKDYGIKYSVSFQSRLGRTPWIKPYTDFVFPELVKKGVKRLAVICPSFVADCLETLEEIQIRGNQQFVSLGGEALKLVPSLNSSESWVKAVGDLARNHPFHQDPSQPRGELAHRSTGRPSSLMGELPEEVK